MKVGEFELVEPVPELKNTRVVAMLRPWVDVGRVGTLTLTKLEQYLGAKELGRLARPGKYFDFTRYRPRMRVVQGRRVFTKPNTIVHYAHDDATDQDYLFLHMREPHAFGEDYTEAIVELLKHFDVTEYCRIGGMYDSVPHTRPLLVTGSMTENQNDKAKDLISPRRSTYQGPTSIVNEITDSLGDLEKVTTNLMVHLPQYVQLDEDHLGASRLMEVLCAAYGLPMTLADVKRGEQQYRDIGKAVESNSEVSSLIEQLETYYDRILSGGSSQEESESEESEQEDVLLSPDVEQFLNEMGQRLAEEDEQSDNDN